MPLGNRRPLYAAAAGKAVLAFFPPEQQDRYLATAPFEQITPHTSRREDMPGILMEVRAKAVVQDRNGSFAGASGIASPVFDRHGRIFATLAIAGPTERIDKHRSRIEQLVREGGEQVSRLIAFAAFYPPTQT